MIDDSYIELTKALQKNKILDKTDWNEEILRESAFARSIQIIEDKLGFMSVGFRYLKEFHIETEKDCEIMGLLIG